ncbi:MAG: alpha-L-glutamate ligase-like protein [Sedimentisphaerales bacterium]|nr:alpha-L-glutamate ligase-like protein [Sedimentisphaerales bacterium]
MRITRKRLFAWPGELRRRGVLGINRRNIEYLFSLNARRLYGLVDDKIITKSLCAEIAVPVPQTYAVINRFGAFKALAATIGQRQEFVVKPAKGSGGRGILIIVGRNGGKFRTANAETVSLDDLHYQISTTLSGLYSLGGQPDRVLVEQRIVPHLLFENLAVGGTPDIRIIVLCGEPVMAMLRLPTKASRGRANLHQGAAAAGIDLDTGRTFGGVCCNRAITVHPDTGAAIEGVSIPYWHRMLEIAGSVSRAVKMGYIGVDIVLDVNHGPLLLEANARPGLSIQIANRCGLLPRLKNAGSQW